MPTCLDSAKPIFTGCCSVTPPAAARKPRPPTLLTVLSRTANIVHVRATENFSENADIVIYPDAGGFAWDDFHRGRELLQTGITACAQQVEAIKKIIARRVTPAKPSSLYLA